MQSKQYSQGSVLLVALALLTAMTLGGMVAMERSTLQLKMVSNMKHQQEHFNSNFGNTNFAVQQMQNNTALATTIFERLLQRELAAIAAGQPEGSATIDPYSDPSLTQRLVATPTPNAVRSVEGVARVDRLPVGGASSGFFAKGAEGNSQNSIVYYNFRFEGSARDNSNNTRSMQMRGLRLAAPSPSQN